MEKSIGHPVIAIYRVALFVMILTAIGGMAFAAGIAWAVRGAHAAGEAPGIEPEIARVERGKSAKGRVVYPKRTDLDFEGAQIDGEIRNPGEFYFQHRTEEKFDSLVKRRRNFHREMLRDVVLSR